MMRYVELDDSAAATGSICNDPPVLAAIEEFLHKNFDGFARSIGERQEPSERKS